MVLCRVAFLAANLRRQDGIYRMVVCDDALRSPMEGSSQTLPRGLDVRLAKSFDSHHTKYVHRLLSRLLEEPENFIQELDL